MAHPYDKQKLLVANRGEIAVRIICTAKKLGLSTIAVYTPSDAFAPHVTLADESIALPLEGEAEAEAYRDESSIVAICKACSATLLHPGYGFLSESAEFAKLVIAAGITWLGPQPEVIRTMGLKHEARTVAIKAGLSVVPGSGLLISESEALIAARQVGFPVILKATAGGGGLGMVVCSEESKLRDAFTMTKGRAKVLFGNDGLFFERYFPAAHHIEIQVFGNGLGHIVHMGERECSIQRRHQKIIEEAPSPFLSLHPDLRDRMCNSALQLCQSIKYGSAGTVEFLVDDNTAEFYFLEMNTRIQVEHPITEAIYPGLDIVELMIKQGIAERRGTSLGPESLEMQQTTYDELRTQGRKRSSHAIEGRVYAENPSEAFLPTPGLLQYVELNSNQFDWLRVDSWISTGLSVTPFFDSLLCKVIVTGQSREEAVSRFGQALSACKIYGPPNNVEYLKAISTDQSFRSGRTMTRFLSDFVFIPRGMKVLSAGVESTIQDLPGRIIGLGVPRGGPMDSMAFRAGNILVGNPVTMEGLEIVLLPGIGFTLEFFAHAVVSITGKKVLVKVNDTLVEMWTRIIIPPSGKLRLDADPNNASTTGFRVYLSIRGGFPNVPTYLGSKSTSMGLGGYQGRSLLVGDYLALGNCGPEPGEESRSLALPQGLVPEYPLIWIIYVLAGPHDSEEYITTNGIEKFYSTKWCVGASSNRTGIRLESQDKIQWARSSGGEGGSHPSNILDNGYAPGTVNITGDTPVILAQDGPDMGGYLSVCTVASSEMWKLGQLSPGCIVEFKRISWAESIRLNKLSVEWLAAVNSLTTEPSVEQVPHAVDLADTPQSPILKAIEGSAFRVVFRQAGDSAILVEFGTMHLDLKVRAHIHVFQSRIEMAGIIGLSSLCPCVRSILCHFDLEIISQSDILTFLVATYESLPESVTTMQLTGRKFTFPIVPNDSWSVEALNRYMRSVRQKAVYLPSNIEYLARNNGLSSAQEVLKKLIESDWLVVGVGFYFACPFLVPLDPRCRIVGQKMNPPRTYTPRGAIGIAGPVAAIYPAESPGGYQLYGRTLPAWQTWGKSKDFHPQRPWLLRAFDQVHFETVSEDEYIKLEKDFDAGKYTFKVESTMFSVADYQIFLDSVADEVEIFKRNQAEGMAREELREQEYLQEWNDGKHADVSAVQGKAQEEGSHGNASTIASPLFASVWKIQIKPGDVIQSGDEVIIILEAMKTEIPVKAGENNVGRRLNCFGKGITEGASVRPGDVLLIFF